MLRTAERRIIRKMLWGIGMVLILGFAVYVNPLDRLVMTGAWTKSLAKIRYTPSAALMTAIQEIESTGAVRDGGGGSICPPDRKTL